MSRRCASEVCQIKASGRPTSFDLSLSQVLTDPANEWNRLTVGRTRVARQIEVDWNTFNQDNFIFSHCTIVSSVATEDNGYYVDAACSPLINNNGNGWTNPVLLATFRSFVGGENYLEHVQIPELSKGKILDAVVRPVKYKNASTGKEAGVYYTDILVATERRHDDLCKKIASGSLSTMSMGCHVAGSMVTMADGTAKPIEDIVIGESVRTHTGDVGVVESTRARLTKDGELRKLSISGIPDTYVTKEHPYWALNGYDRCAGCGDCIPRGKPWSLDQIMRQWCSKSCYQTFSNTNPKSYSVATMVEQKVNFTWVKTEDLRIGDYVAIPLGRPKRQRSSMEIAKCRLLGFYAAEGNLQRASTGEIRAVEFSLGYHEPIAYEIEKFAKSLVDDSKVYIQDRERKSGKSTRVVIHDKELAKWLYDSCGEHCDGKKFAPWVSELNDDSILNILGAYIDGDGHCRKDTARFSTASCSKRLSEQIWSMMISMGISATFGSRIKKSGKKDHWVVSVRKGCGTRLNGYCSKYLDQKESNSKTSNFHGHMLRKVTANEFVDGHYFVYNLHIENKAKDHSFFVNGVPCHNCLANYVQCSRCGVVLGDNDPNCVHIDNQLLQNFVDEDGVTRIVAELCGRSFRDKKGNWVGDPDSVKFIEASWVDKPAFEGAVMNHFLSECPKDVANVLAFSTEKLEQTMDDLLKMRVADSRGMMVLRVAIAELNRRKREEMASRVAKTFWS